MQASSRARTAQVAEVSVTPVMVQGYARIWGLRANLPGLKSTFLTAVVRPTAGFNAVLFPVTVEQLAAFDQRERGYTREAVPRKHLQILTQHPVSCDQVWIYAFPTEQLQLPTAAAPIAQSYLDVFLSGCLEQQEQHHLHGFAQQCVTTTQGWSRHWENDRIFPRRPFVYQPKALAIDRLLQRTLPKLFDQINPQ